MLDCIELFLSMRGCLEIKSFVADAFLATLRILHSACNFGIIRLNDKILPSTEQLLNFIQADDKEFHF
ncbi:hypothetical protein [Campylobacter concisus]|uniref:hypothetical protein n=1 Tax=Campylobacter concisus TaxID=199 RepID=UPI00112FA521|nr:hypothetical protein [Campylobacter concisus]